MRIAYADPPYMGCGKYYPEKKEIDYVDLIYKLENDYDRWALSCHVPSLHQILNLCPEEVRVGAWVKPWCSFKAANPAYCWEPVIFVTGLKHGKGHETVRDFIIANQTRQKGLTGAKPIEFCVWILKMLGVQQEDVFDDLYPGTNIMEKAKKLYFASNVLFGEKERKSNGKVQRVWTDTE